MVPALGGFTWNVPMSKENGATNYIMIQLKKLAGFGEPCSAKKQVLLRRVARQIFDFVRFFQLFLFKSIKLKIHQKHESLENLEKC
jgi:hypothetical protein